MRRVLLALAGLATVAAIGVGAARAADECTGLPVCLPAAGPWVVIPAGTGVVEYSLKCPRRNYIVAGTDVRLSDPEIDVALRGETGSPVSPGVTTTESVVFVARYVGRTRRAVTFQPFIGCVPTAGGGGRGLTAHAQTSPGLRPTRPLVRIVVDKRLRAATVTIRAACPKNTRLLGRLDAVGFRTAVPPPAVALETVELIRSRQGTAVAVKARARGAIRALKPEVQVQALCAKGRR